MTMISLDALVPRMSEGNRVEIAEADVVVAVDLATQAEFTVFGTPPLESTVSLKHPLAMRMVRISFDRKTADLAQVIAMVRGVKGREAFGGDDE
jgi:hypothetical protein